MAITEANDRHDGRFVVMDGVVQWPRVPVCLCRLHAEKIHMFFSCNAVCIRRVGMHVAMLEPW